VQLERSPEEVRRETLHLLREGLKVSLEESRVDRMEGCRPREADREREEVALKTRVYLERASLIKGRIQNE
jgi:hypothetical protein